MLFIDLHGYEDTPATADQAVLSLLRALGIRSTDLPPTPDEQYGLYRSVFTQLADAQKPVLLVLDNASTPSQIAPLLPGGSDHRVLVTSRDSLDSLPARLISVDTLDPDAAATLIRRSLQLADPTDERTAQEHEATRQLTVLCGHLPLALQIAAAQLRRRRRRPIAGLVAELQAAKDRLLALHARGVDQYDRPLTLRPVFDVTYQRLEPDQARLFRFLALIPAPDFGAQAAVAMAQLPEVDVLALLDELAAASLVTPAPDCERWRLHDLVRVYAQTMVEGDAGLGREAEEARGRLLAFYYEWVRAADGHLRALPGAEVLGLFEGRGQALVWLDAERAGLLGAVLWAEDSVHAETALRLGLCLGEYLCSRRYFGDGVVVMEAARDAAQRVADRRGEAVAWNNLGNALQELRHFGEAAEAHTRARNICVELRDRQSEATAWTNLGSDLQGLRHFVEAVGAHTRARDICVELRGRHGEATAWNNLGNALLELRRFVKAVEACTHARDVFAELGDRRGEAAAWNNLGSALQELRRFVEAVEACTRAQGIHAELRDRHGEAMAWNNLGLALRGLRRFEEAAEALTHARNIYVELRDRHREATAWNNLGLTLQKLRRFGETLDAYRYGETLFVDFGDWYRVGVIRWNIALLFEAQQRISEAKAAWAATAEAFTRAGATEDAAKARQRAE